MPEDRDNLRTEVEEIEQSCARIEKFLGQLKPQDPQVLLDIRASLGRIEILLTGTGTGAIAAITASQVRIELELADQKKVLAQILEEILLTPPATETTFTLGEQVPIPPK